MTIDTFDPIAGASNTGIFDFILTGQLLGNGNITVDNRQAGNTARMARDSAFVGLSPLEEFLGNDHPAQ